MNLKKTTYNYVMAMCTRVRALHGKACMLLWKGREFQNLEVRGSTISAEEDESF